MPFTRDAFLGVFAAYNDALWPLALALWVLTAVACGRWMIGARRGESFLRQVLGVNWLWAGVVYHAAFFTRTNRAAWIFAAMFLFEAAVLMNASGSTRAPAVGSLSRRRAALAFALIAYGLVYPAIVQADGFAYPFAPTFGVPCPTTILTIGFLLASPQSALVSAVPILWSAIGGSASWLFGVHADVVLPAAGLMLAVDVFRRPVIHKGVAT